MKMKKYFVAFGIILAVTVLSAIPSFASASVDGIITSTEKFIAEDDRAEQVGYKYKTENGITYRRLWSYTYNHWIDPEWIPIS